MHNQPGPTDTVPAWLSPGEAVLNKEAAEMMGRDKIKAMNDKGAKMRRKGIVPVQGFENGTDEVKSVLPQGVQKTGTSYSATMPEGTGSISSDPRFKQGAQINRLDGTVGTGGSGYQDSIKPDTSTPKSSLTSLPSTDSVGYSGPGMSSGYYQSRATQTGLMDSNPNKGNFANQTTGITTLGGGSNAQSTANKGAGAMGVGGILRSLGVGSAPAIKPMNGTQVWNQQQGVQNEIKNLTQGLGDSVVDWSNAPGFQDGIEEITPKTTSGSIKAKLGDNPALQEASRRVKYPEAYQPGQSPQAHGFSAEEFSAPPKKPAAGMRSVEAPDLARSMERGVEPRSSLALEQPAGKGFQMAEFEPPAPKVAGKGIIPVGGRYTNVEAPYKQPGSTYQFKPGQGTPGAGTASPGGFTLGEGPAAPAPVKAGTAMVPVEGTLKSTPGKTGFEFRPGQGTPGAGSSAAGDFTLGKGPAGNAFRAAEAIKNAPQIDPYTGEAIRPGGFGEYAKGVATKAANAGKGIVGKAANFAKSVATAPETLVPLAEQYNTGRTESLLTNPDRGTAGTLELAQRAPVYAATRFNPIEIAKAAQKAKEQKENTPLPAGAELKNGATVGNKEPEVDFSNPSISDIVGEKIDVNAPKDGTKEPAPEQPVSAEWSADNERYKAEQAGAADRAKEMEAVKAAEQQKKGLERGVSDFWKNMGYSGGAAQYRAEKQMQQLQDIALNGGGTGDMTAAEFANANRRQKAAQQRLSDIQHAQTEREGHNARLGEAQAAREEARSWKEMEANRAERWRGEDKAQREQEREENRTFETEKAKNAAAAKEALAAEKPIVLPDGTIIKSKDVDEYMARKQDDDLKNLVANYVKNSGGYLESGKQDAAIQALIDNGYQGRERLAKLRDLINDDRATEAQKAKATAELNATARKYGGF